MKTCKSCGIANEMLISSGFKHPANKGKKYFTCSGCGTFQMEEQVGEWGYGDVFELETKETAIDPIKTGDSMLACNAANNTIELIKTGAVKIEDLEKCTERIYRILYKLVYGGGGEK